MNIKYNYCYLVEYEKYTRICLPKSLCSDNFNENFEVLPNQQYANWISEIYTSGPRLNITKYVSLNKKLTTIYYE